MLASHSDAAEWRPVSGEAQLEVRGPLPNVEAGDRLRVFAQLAAPLPPHNPGQFDSAALLRGQRIRSQLEAKFGESYGLPVFYFTQVLGLALGLDPKALGLSSLVVDPMALVSRI